MKNTQKGFGLIGLIILIAIIAGGYYYYKKGVAGDLIDGAVEIGKKPINAAEDTRDNLQKRYDDISDEYDLGE